MHFNKKHFIIIGAAVAAPILLYLYHKFNPALSEWFPKCLFYSLFGIPCPGCGSQRAIHSLLNLEFADAFRYNAMVVMAIPILAVLISASALRDRVPAFFKAVHHPAVSISLAASIIAWWILRIIFHWYV